MTTAPPTSTPPSPAEATDEAAFVAELRRLKTWSGRSFRQLERQATAAGDVLPASTAATVLGKHRLPREELLIAWLATRALIADGRIADDRNADATAVAPAASPRRRPTPRWRLAMAAAVLAIAFAGGAAFTAGLESESIDEQETVVLTP